VVRCRTHPKQTLVFRLSSFALWLHHWPRWRRSGLDTLSIHRNLAIRNRSVEWLVSDNGVAAPGSVAHGGHRTGGIASICLRESDRSIEKVIRNGSATSLSGVSGTNPNSSARAESNCT